MRKFNFQKDNLHVLYFVKLKTCRRSLIYIYFLIRFLKKAKHLKVKENQKCSIIKKLLRLEMTTYFSPFGYKKPKMLSLVSIKKFATLMRLLHFKICPKKKL